MQSRKRRSNPPAKSAYASALTLLARRPHSIAELRMKLMRRGYSAEELGGTVERLTASGYLDDQAFAAGLVRRRQQSRGSFAIGAELAAKGIAREVAGQALEQLDLGSEIDAALHLTSRLGSPVDPRVLARKLAGRGFSAQVVWQVVRMRHEADLEPDSA